MIKTCNLYGDTNNVEFCKHWNALKEQMQSGNYTITQLEDYIFVREII